VTRRLAYSDAAYDDIADIAEYIAEESGSAATATRFAKKIEARCERLAALPGILGTHRSDLAPSLRSTLFRNYVIFFRYHDDAVEIVNVLDARRDHVAHFDEPE
jgi:toxin ParE1/3/4